MTNEKYKKVIYLYVDYFFSDIGGVLLGNNLSNNFLNRIPNGMTTKGFSIIHGCYKMASATNPIDNSHGICLTLPMAMARYGQPSTMHHASNIPTSPCQVVTYGFIHAQHLFSCFFIHFHNRPFSFFSIDCDTFLVLCF